MGITLRREFSKGQFHILTSSCLDFPSIFFFGRLYLLLAKKKFMEVEIKILGAGEMTHWLRVLVALSEDLASTPHTHIVSHSHV